MAIPEERRQLLAVLMGEETLPLHMHLSDVAKFLSIKHETARRWLHLYGWRHLKLAAGPGDKPRYRINTESFLSWYEKNLVVEAQAQKGEEPESPSPLTIYLETK